MLLACGALMAIVLAPQAQESQPGTAIVLDVEGIIGPASADYVTRGLSGAAERKASVVLIRMDTPGGLDTSMRDIIRAIMASTVPVITYVTPGGARAASAGTYILYASHVAAMAPGTNLGAATPVAIGGLPIPDRGDERPERAPGTDRGDRKESDSGGGTPRQMRGRTRRVSLWTRPARGGEPANASEAKAINDAVAYIRSLAEFRGRNADWAEAAVRDAASLSASAALKQDVIDFVASSVEDLFGRSRGARSRCREARCGSLPATCSRIHSSPTGARRFWESSPTPTWRSS